MEAGSYPLIHSSTLFNVKMINLPAKPLEATNPHGIAHYGFRHPTRLEICCPSEGVLAGLRLLAAGKVPSRVPWQQLGMIWEVQLISRQAIGKIQES